MIDQHISLNQDWFSVITPITWNITQGALLGSSIGILTGLALRYVVPQQLTPIKNEA